MSHIYIHPPVPGKRGLSDITLVKGCVVVDFGCSVSWGSFPCFTLSDVQMNLQFAGELLG